MGLILLVLVAPSFDPYKMVRRFAAATSRIVHTDPSAPRAGETAVLAPEVREMLSCARALNLSDFGYGQGIVTNDDLHFPAIEALYPCRCSSSSQFVFYLKNEPVPQGSLILTQGVYVKVARHL